jgi:hypothetical protein
MGYRLWYDLRSFRATPSLTESPADAHPEAEVLGVDLVPVQPHKYVQATINVVRQLTTLTQRPPKPKFRNRRPRTRLDLFPQIRLHPLTDDVRRLSKLAALHRPMLRVRPNSYLNPHAL